MVLVSRIACLPGIRQFWASGSGLPAELFLVLLKWDFAFSLVATLRDLVHVESSVSRNEDFPSCPHLNLSWCLHLSCDVLKRLHLMTCCSPRVSVCLFSLSFAGQFLLNILYYFCFLSKTYIPHSVLWCFPGKCKLKAYSPRSRSCFPTAEGAYWCGLQH